MNRFLLLLARDGTDAADLAVLRAVMVPDTLVNASAIHAFAREKGTKHGATHALLLESGVNFDLATPIV